MKNRNEIRVVDYCIMHHLVTVTNPVMFVFLDQLHTQLVAIPVYVPLTLEVATGFKYGSFSAFDHFNSQLKKAVANICPSTFPICNGN